MAATGFTPISLYYSSTTGTSPTAGNLVAGELALNTFDGKLFYKDSAGVVQVIATKGTGTIGGSNTQVQYNSSGAFAGSANMTFNGTTLTLANDASISGLTVGRGYGATVSNTALGISVLGSSSLSGGGNTGIGYSALPVNTSGTQNTAIGNSSLVVNTTGSENVALGSASLYSNTTGNYNVAVGRSSLFSNTTASNNTAVGYQAAYNNTTGAITAIGYQAGLSNTTGAGNVALGDRALNTNTTTSYNTAVGNLALYSNTASGNTAVGWGVLYANTTGISNVGVGGYDGSADPTLRFNTTGSYNTALGISALKSNTTASKQTAVGYQAIYGATTIGDQTAIGYQALYTGGGGGDVAVGEAALYSGTSAGGANTAVGYFTAYATTSGANNTALGREALRFNTTASNNTAVGYQAGYANTTGTNNLFIGKQAGSATTTGSYNTFVGGGVNGSGEAVTTGSKNTILGSYSGNQGGLDIRTSSNYIVLSDGDGNPRVIVNDSGKMSVGGTSNVGVIGAIQSGAGGYCMGTSAYVNGGTYYHMQFLEGVTNRGSITSNGSSTTYATTSDYRLKENVQPMVDSLSKVAQLKPCTYTWKSNNSEGQGFIAHELAEVFPDAVVGEKDAVDSEGNSVYQGIDTSFLVATLTAAIQELKAEVDALKAAK